MSRFACKNHLFIYIENYYKRSNVFYVINEKSKDFYCDECGHRPAIFLITESLRDTDSINILGAFQKGEKQNG